MAKFNGFILTEKGRELLAKGLSGETITFTKMAIGDGTSLTSERERTALINQITTLPILNINVKRNGTCEINALLTNKSVTTGFYIKELGIFAHGNDNVEILYAYNISTSPDFVPPFSANNVVEIEYVDTIIVDQVANVTAVIDPSVTYITKKYADENYLVSSRLAEILGLQFGGNIQDIGNKTKGKFYYDSVTKFYCECIEDNSLTYNDSGKFRPISNKPLSDKVENLYKNNKNGYLKLGNILIQWGFVSVPTNQYTLIYPVAYKELPSIVTSNWSFNDTVTHTGRSQSQCLFSSNTGSMGFDWMTVGVI
nr:MAG TPA: tail collar fiber protein [Caudoviricetes sp.]